MTHMIKVLKLVGISFLIFTILIQSVFGNQGKQSDCENLWIEMKPSTESTLKTERGQGFEKIRLEYNELLETEVSRTHADQKVFELIEKYQEINPAFPAESFVQWMKEGPVLNRIFAEKDQRKLGEVAQGLYEEYFPFLKKEQKTFAERARLFSSSVAKPFDQLWDKTQTEGKIPPEDLEDFHRNSLRSFRKFVLGTCLEKNEAFFKSMVSNVVVTVLMFGLHAAREKPAKAEDFPWEFFFNDIFWSVAFDRVACKKMMAIDHRLGMVMPEAGKMGYLMKAKENFQKTVVPFIPYYAMGAVTGSAGNWYMDRFQRGTTEEDKPNDVYFYNFGFFNVFNALWTIPKRVFILDPVYAKAFPKLEAAIEGLTQSGLAAKVVRYGTEYPAKIALSEYAQFGIFLDAKEVWEVETLPALKDFGRDLFHSDSN